MTLAALRSCSAGAETDVEYRSVTLAKTTLTDIVSASGAVRSGETTNVYARQNYPVAALLYDVGDEVREGDILALLDTGTLEIDIEIAENSLRQSEDGITDEERASASSSESARIQLESAKVQLDKARTSYETQQSELDARTAGQLVSSKNAVDSASDAVQSARSALSVAKIALDSADRSLANAKTELTNREGDYSVSQTLFGAGVISKNELDNADKALTQAGDAVKSAEDALERERSNYDKAQSALSQAERSLANAEENYNSTESQLSNSLASARKDVTNAELSVANAQNAYDTALSKRPPSMIGIENQKLQLEKLRETFADREVRAAASGVVTQRGATVGAPASGAMFVIESRDDLYVSVRVKEYNLPRLSVGQKAVIGLDAAGDRALDGELTYIAPKAATEAGSAAVEFDAKIRIIDDDPAVRIGMTAFVSIVTDELKDVYAVPYDAVSYDDDGGFVYRLADGAPERVSVKTGLQTAQLVEITGDGLSEGMEIALSAEEVTGAGDAASGLRIVGGVRQ
ncbi:MAG: efflux RND transporter periplasmic adaptor subunit [Clostridiales bacterium]|nr:efflux RND transporter periplasmic adaptor subunit [Clostridiales bacterium]